MSGELSAKAPTLCEAKSIGRMVLGQNENWALQVSLKKCVYVHLAFFYTSFV
jgi:hypothetical protein